MSTSFHNTHASVLVVDDHPYVGETAEFLLRKLGINNVLLARNGREAREMLDGGGSPAELILCDLSMPEEDGLVFLRWLSQQRVRPAVALMSGVDPILLPAAKRLGEHRNLDIVGMIEKPLSVDMLRSVLERVWTPCRRAKKLKTGLVLSDEEIAESLKAGHYEVWFQPQIDTATGTVRGCEALLRLRHPEHGLVGPCSFIPQAEHSGEIAGLTEFAIERSVEWCSAWRNVGHPLSVSINLSAKVLDDLSYPDRLAEICARHDVGPESIVLELTETSLAGDPDTLLDIMARLRLKKFRLSIDDFGTGFSSLEQLKGLPFHELKVDKKFIFDAVDDRRSRSILENSLHLASSLNLNTVAEGVETPAQLDLVSRLGCQTAQGFLIAKPMPAAAVIDWLAGYRR